jgi:hypothetical protein
LYRFLVVHTVRYRFLRWFPSSSSSSSIPTCSIPTSGRYTNIPSPPTPSPKKTEKLASPHPQETPNIPSPPPRSPPPPPSPHETTKPTHPNGSARNNHAKVGTSGPNTSVIGPGETPLGKKALEKPSAISKLQEEKLAKNNSSTAGKQALKKPSSAISKQQEKEIAVNKTSKRPTRKRSKRKNKENRRYMTSPKQSESDTKKNPWAMANPNYKFGKNILSNGDLKKAAPFTRKLHILYMQMW